MLGAQVNSLRQNVDAYATNIDGNGYRFDAVIDFDAEDARSTVADAMTIERLAARDAGALPEGMTLTPSAEEVLSRFTEQACTPRALRGLSTGRAHRSGGPVSGPPRPLRTLSPPQRSPHPSYARHATIEMTERYAHLSPEMLASAVQQLDRPVPQLHMRKRGQRKSPATPRDY